MPSMSMSAMIVSGPSPLPPTVSGPDGGPVGSANGPHQAQSLERSVLGTRREHREGVEDDGGLGIVLVQPDDDRGRHHLRDFGEEDVAAGPATDDWVVGA